MEACKCVIIIEDDDAIRETLQMVIEAEGYKVKTASNGLEAVALLKTLLSPCLILTDLMMPEMNGYEFISLASETHTIASIPIVVVSAVADPHPINDLTKSGKIKGLIKKPVNLEYLLSVVHDHCGVSKHKAA